MWVEVKVNIPLIFEYVRLNGDCIGPVAARMVKTVGHCTGD